MNDAGIFGYQDLLQRELVNVNTIILSGLDPNSAVYIDAGQALADYILTNGQLLIGNTSGPPLPNTLTGGTNITITNGHGTITLDTIQPITPSSDPTFNTVTASRFIIDPNYFLSIIASLPTITLDAGDTISYNRATNTLTITLGGGTAAQFLNGLIITPVLQAIASSNQIILRSGNTQTINAVNPAASRIISIQDAGANSNFVLSEGAQTINAALTLTIAPTFSSLTATRLVATNGTSQLQSISITNSFGTNTTFSGSTLAVSMVQNLSPAGGPSFNTLTLGGITPSAGLRIGSTGAIQAVSQANGQLLIGAGIGSVPVAANITGTVDQVIVTDGPGTITLSAPQSIGPGSSPTFTNLTLSGLTATRLVATNGTSQLQSISISNANGTNLSFATNVLAASMTQNLGTTGSPSFTGLTLTGTTQAAALRIGAAGALVGVSLTAGQLLIGTAVGSVPVAANITGTANQVVVTNGSGTITLSAPQAIAPGSSPTFTNLTLTGLTASQPVKTDASKLLVSGLISLTTDVTGVLPIANGGTASSTALSNNRIMVSNTGAIKESAALTNGQLLIGSSAAAPVVANLTGTTNQVIVTNGAGAITLSLPQSIDITSNVTFNSVTAFDLTSQTLSVQLIKQQLSIYWSGTSTSSIASGAFASVGNLSTTTITDYGGMFAAPQFNIKATGKYQLNAQFRMADQAVAAADSVGIKIFKNGAALAEEAFAWPDGGGRRSVALQVLYPFNNGDAIRFGAFQASGVNLSFTWLSMSILLVGT